MAVTHADHILQLQENLDSNEMPPEWMWPFTSEMNAWLDRVSVERRSRYGGSAAGGSDEDLQENELLAGAR